eukprot:s500_g3.t1
MARSGPLLLALLAWCPLRSLDLTWVAPLRAASKPRTPGRLPLLASAPSTSTSTSGATDTAQELKWKLLRLAAALDRGQAYNPTSGEYYAERMAVARGLLKELLPQSPPLPASLEALDGEWELVFSSVKHGIFRSSPFFLAVQEAFGEAEKSELFFKLHELQVMSWGASKVGRVAQPLGRNCGVGPGGSDTTFVGPKKAAL